ncbi:lysophosphatidic acid receptor 6 [Aulostomus maculatus]
MSINTNISCHNSSASPNSTLYVCVYSCIFLVGLIFNLQALVVFFCRNKSKSQTTVYMTNLAVADVLLSLTLPLRIYYYLGFAVDQWLCDILGLVLKANMYGSIFLLMCISFDRCMAVTFPMSFRVQEGRKRAPLVCSGVWMLSIGTSIPIYLSTRTRISLEKHCFDNMPVYATQPVVVLPTLLVGFGFPLLVMITCSWGLVSAVKQSIVAQTNLVDIKKIQRMIAASLLIFLISFLPYHVILGLLSLFGQNISCSMLAAYRYSLMLACLNTVLDPIAYYFTTDTFRSKVDVGAIQGIFPLNSQSSLQLNRRNRMQNNS